MDLAMLAEAWPILGSVVGALLGGAAVYGGIRADLANQRETLARAHARIDEHINMHATGEF